MSESVTEHDDGRPAGTTDPTFYRSAAEAAAAPPEKLAYVAAFDRAARTARRDRVVDADPASADYGEVVGWTDLPTRGDELHHFGWNACCSALMHEGHDMADGLQRRYLLVPGLRCSRIHVSTPSPTRARRVCTRRSRPRSWPSKAGYSRPHTLHCGPDGVFLTCLGGARRRRRAGRHRAARPQHLRRAAGRGRPTAGRSTSPTTPGGTSTRTR